MAYNSAGAADDRHRATAQADHGRRAVSGLGTVDVTGAPFVFSAGYSDTLATLSRFRYKPFESYAQNFEDVVLWRVFDDVEAGTYVDVGAFDPVLDSISFAYYEQGWRGVLIEPVPSLAAALRQQRPNDVTIEAAAGATRGTSSLFVSRSTGNSTLVRDVADRLAATGIDFSQIVTPVAPLDDLLEEAGLDGRTIHFCSVDVEGSEAAVLAGFDLPRWSPWILVVEATEPNMPLTNREPWERHVLEAGYVFCLFDGVNRFYVHPDKADGFAERLSYPACVFDDAFRRAVSRARRGDELERRCVELESRTNELERERIALLERANDATGELHSMRASMSWRVTRPLRAIHGAGFHRLPTTVHRALEVRGSPSARRDLERAFARRVAQVADVLNPELHVGSGMDVHEALSVLEDALPAASASDHAKAWLALVAVDGRYPMERSVGRVARVLRMGGPGGVCEELLRLSSNRAERGSTTMGELDVLRDRVVVDVTHTAVASDLHTGIQRVVRETVARWIDSDRPMDLIRFDLERPAARRLSAEERARLENWRDHVGPFAAPRGPRSRTRTPSSTVVPWRCTLVVPELPFESERTAAYRGLVTASVLRSLALVGFDLIPIVASEKVVPDLTAAFGPYLSIVKHANRVAAISRTSSDGFRAVAAMAAAEGLPPPTVEAYELPAEAPKLDPARLEAARHALGIGHMPAVVVVGSHEPRKNHLTVLEAAERLWRASDRSFQLVFLGWSGWLGEEFDDLVRQLVSAGRPIVVRKRSSETELWAAYRLARFTVFPSLLEGFGLPIAESLASGTPVITSNYGSMAEVAEKGGCVLVDPRDVGQLERAMALLLDDDAVLGALRDEALAADTGTWDGYSSRLWDFLADPGVEERGSSQIA